MTELLQDVDRAATISAPYRYDLPDDTIILGEPAAPIGYEIAWSELIHSVTGGFFDERDPACSIGPTVVKLAGVVAVVTGVVLAVLATFSVITVLTFHVVFD